MKVVKKIAKLILLLALVLLLIEVSLNLLDVPNYLLPKPSKVGDIIYSRFDYLITNTFYTIIESIAGFIMGNVLAFSFSILIHNYASIEKKGLALAVLLKATPVIALAPLFVIWFGNGMFGKILMAALVCFFPMIINTTTGLRNVNPDLIDYAESLKLSRFTIIRHIKIPAISPYIFAALKTSSTVSIVGAIIAELTGSDFGIGHILQVSIYQLETEIMFAGIFLISLFGLIFYFFIQFIEDRYNKKIYVS